MTRSLWWRSRRIFLKTFWTWCSSCARPRSVCIRCRTRLFLVACGFRRRRCWIGLGEVIVLRFAEDDRMKEREMLALEFYACILAPDEEPGFVSDEANLLDLSLAPERELIERI